MSTPYETLESPPSTTPQAQGGQFTRVVKMFTQPTAAFAELAARPTWLVALVVLVAASLAVQAVLVPRIDLEATIRQSMEERVGDKVDEAQLERMVEGAEKAGRITSYLAPLAIPLVLLVVAAVYFLGLKALGSDTAYPAVFATCVHAAVPPSVVGSAVLAIVAWRRDALTAQEIPNLVKSHLGAWLPPDTAKPLLALANAVDLFNVWQWILLVLGFEIVARVGRSKAIALVAVVWGVWIAGKVLLAVVL